METNRIEKGTIFRNCYATLPTFMIYDHTYTASQGINKVEFAVGYELVYLHGKWSLNNNAKYYKRDLFKNVHFKKVGKFDTDRIIRAILKEINKNSAITDRV